jgi:NADPH2:quinone reductase
VALDGDDPVASIRAYAPAGVHRIRGGLSDNADLEKAVVANGAVFAACATRDDRPRLPFRPLLFDNVTLRVLGSDDFPAAAKRQAARDLTAAAVGMLTVAIGDLYSL